MDFLELLKYARRYESHHYKTYCPIHLIVAPFNVFSCLSGSILEGPDAETLGPIVQEVCVVNVLLVFYFILSTIVF